MPDNQDNISVSETLTILLGFDTSEVRDILETEIERFESYFNNLECEAL